MQKTILIDPEVFPLAACLHGLTRGRRDVPNTLGTTRTDTRADRLMTSPARVNNREDAADTLLIVTRLSHASIASDTPHFQLAGEFDVRCELWFRKKSAENFSLLFRGSFQSLSTKRESLKAACREFEPHIVAAVSDYLRGSLTYLDELQHPEFSGLLRLQPRLTSQLLKMRSIAQRALARIRRGHPRTWEVRFSSASWPRIETTNLQRLVAPEGRYFADPFLVRHEGKTVCFVEEAGIDGSKGCISAVDLSAGDIRNYIGAVLEESFHLSFPFPFLINGQLYLMPESAASHSIRIYKCLEFPSKWKLEHVIADDVEAYDSMIFPSGDGWRLLTTLTPPGSTDKVSRLYEATVEDPLKSRVREEDFELVFCSPRGGRNAGFIEDARATIRASQIQTADTYGAGLILEDSGHFGLGKVIWGSHHIHSTQAGTVMDFLEQ
jgi:hypothetical protein